PGLDGLRPVQPADQRPRVLPAAGVEQRQLPLRADGYVGPPVAVIWALRAAAVVAAACGLAAGCGSSDGAAARRPTASLTVAYRASGPGAPQHVWTLTCGPPGGTHPRP